MKLLGFTLIAVGIAFGSITFAIDFDGLLDCLRLIPSLLMILAGVGIWRCKIHRRHTAKLKNVFRVLLLLLVGIPMMTFGIIMIPTFISSFFLKPGQAEWVAYGIAVLILPFLLWGWWIYTRMLFSKTYRGVVFSDPGDDVYYADRAPFPKQEGGRTVKTSTRRAGTSKARMKLYSGNVVHGTLFLILLGLTRIPLLGLIFSPLKNRVFETSGRRMDELKEAVDRLEAPTLDEMLSADSRKPVLLLRSFLDDCLPIESLENEGKNHDKITFEELICREASDWGPVIAIGKPGEESPPLGAARAYFTNDTWQEHAISMLNRSCVVILIMGHTPSVAWELEKILNSGHASKTIVMIPPTEDEGYRARLEQLREITERVSGQNMVLKLPTGHHLLAVAFTTQTSAKLIVGPHQVSLAFVDALKLGSKVVHSQVAGLR